MSALLAVRCACQHRLPIRVQEQGLGALRQLVEATTAPPTGDEVLLTFRCSNCKQIVEMRLSDLGITEGAA